MAQHRQRRRRSEDERELEAEGRDEALLGETEPADPHEHGHAHEAHPRKGLFGRAADFLRACVQELRRVQWPDRRQVGQGTAVTLGFVVVAGAYLGLLDAIWNPVVQWI